MLPEAIRYGMSQEEFWHGDMRLLSAAQKAYFRDKSYSAWINGQYTFIALQSAIHNAMRTKISEKCLEYPQWTDPFQQKQVITESMKEQKFRSNMQRMSEQLKKMR